MDYTKKDGNDREFMPCFDAVMEQLGEAWFGKKVIYDDYYSWYNYSDRATLPGRSLGDFDFYKKQKSGSFFTRKPRIYVYRY